MTNKTPPDFLFHALHVYLSRQKRSLIILQEESEKLQKQQGLSTELLRKVAHLQRLDERKNKNGLFSEYTNQESNNGSEVIQKRFKTLKRQEAYVIHLTRMNKFFTLQVKEIKDFIYNYHKTLQGRRESFLQELYERIMNVSFCESCFRYFSELELELNERHKDCASTNGNGFSKHSKHAKHRNSKDYHSDIYYNDKHKHRNQIISHSHSSSHKDLDESSLRTKNLEYPKTLKVEDCQRCHLVAFCSLTDCERNENYHHSTQTCSLMEAIQKIDMLDLYGRIRNDEQTVSKSLEEMIDESSATSDALVHHSVNTTASSLKKQDSNAIEHTSETLSALKAHREYVDNIVLKKHEDTIFNDEAIRLMNELKDWSDKSRTDISSFLLKEEERQRIDELNICMLNDDLERIKSFLSASLFQREHFLSETEKGGFVNKLNNPLRDFYSSNFKESNPDFILQFQLVRLVLELKERLSATDKHTSTLKARVAELEEKLENDKKLFQKQIGNRDYMIDELSQKNRALQMNYDNIQEKYHQALVFSKKRSRKVAPTTAISTQTDLKHTYGLLSSAQRQVVSLKNQITSMRRHQLEQDDMFTAIMTSIEGRILEKTTETETHLARVSVSLQQARAKIAGKPNFDDALSTVEVQTDPIVNMRSMHVEDVAIQVPDTRFPILKQRTRSRSIIQNQGVEESSESNDTLEDISDMQNKLLSIEPKRPERKRTKSQIMRPNDTTSPVADTTVKGFANLKFSKYLSFAIQDSRTIIKKMALDNWCLFNKISRIQLIGNILTLDSEFISYDVDLRAKLMLRLYDRVQQYLHCWRLRRKMYIRIRLQLEKAFKLYMIKTTSELQSYTLESQEKPKKAKVTYEDLASSISLFLPDKYESQWYSLTSGFKKNAMALMDHGSSFELLTKKERLRIEAIAPLWKYNFGDISVNTRKNILLELYEFVKKGQKESEEEKKELLFKIRTQIEQDSQDYTRIEDENDSQSQLSNKKSKKQNEKLKASMSEAKQFVQKTMAHNAKKSFTLIDTATNPEDPELVEKRNALEMKFNRDLQELREHNVLSDIGNEVNTTSKPKNASIKATIEEDDEEGQVIFSKMQTERRESLPTLTIPETAGSGIVMKSNITPRDPLRSDEKKS